MIRWRNQAKADTTDGQMTTKVGRESMGNAGRSPGHGYQLADLAHADDIVAGIFTTHDLKSGLATVWPEFAGAETAQ
jgi:hypothetical protein